MKVNIDNSCDVHDWFNYLQEVCKHKLSWQSRVHVYYMNYYRHVMQEETQHLK